MTLIDGWEDVGDVKSEKMSFRTAPSTTDDEGDPTPAYEESVDYRPPGMPPRLRVVGATWGGVNVTDDVQSMVTADETVAFDMRSIHRVLVPDPAPGVVKTLSVLYQYEDQDGVRLLHASEHMTHIQIYNTPDKLATSEEHQHHLKPLERPWRAGPAAQVEILAVLYGPQRIETPAVLQELSKFFEGRRGQIRMTNAFFKTDPWPYHVKSWSVYFRFVDSKRIQCVTGMENGALEIPWSRHY
ncbi:hypothetical protein B0H63DRAFT_471820 [Podospora didyma]|uniref:Uncharacterized protein n=1 Tax=Podospora didyma TaxID=330526 RepID=A0AAE0NNN6_9PEZI|nr:hypothetical protein B0H63DRAFT_471820 [Podospora didyma]